MIPGSAAAEREDSSEVTTEPRDPYRRIKVFEFDIASVADFADALLIGGSMEMAFRVFRTRWFHLGFGGGLSITGTPNTSGYALFSVPLFFQGGIRLGKAMSEVKVRLGTSITNKFGRSSFDSNFLIGAQAIYRGDDESGPFLGVDVVAGERPGFFLSLGYQL